MRIIRTTNRFRLHPRIGFTHRSNGTAVLLGDRSWRNISGIYVRIDDTTTWFEWR